MIIALILNRTKMQSKSIAMGIKEFLTNHHITVVTEDEDAEEMGLKGLSTIDPAEVQFVISLGGDGTFLRLVHRHTDLHSPMLGINLGSLGFLADTPVPDIYPSLQDLIKGDFDIEERLMLEGETLKGERCIALNDIVVHRAKNPSLVDLAIHVDGEYLNTFSADGVIVSTPCGSTAYSLSAGGPILTPELEAIVLTPICPHTISNRPIVLMPKEEIQIQYISEYDPVEISYDGMTHFTISTGEVLRIFPSPRKLRLVCLRRHNYFQTLRTKLGWTGKLKVT